MDPLNDPNSLTHRIWDIGFGLSCILFSLQNISISVKNQIENFQWFLLRSMILFYFFRNISDVLIWIYKLKSHVKMNLAKIYYINPIRLLTLDPQGSISRSNRESNLFQEPPFAISIGHVLVLLTRLLGSDSHRYRAPLSCLPINLPSSIYFMMVYYFNL